MREYGITRATFWTGKTGKEIKKLGQSCQLLASYLQSNPHSNRLGLYYLPLPFLCHELAGFDEEGASKALRSLSEVDFAHYDPETEHVFVVNMAYYQNDLEPGEVLDPKDKRVPGIKRMLATMPKTPLKERFFETYKEAFHLERGLIREPKTDQKKGDPVKGLPRDSEGASKPHRSQDQDQDQEQDNPPTPLATLTPVDNSGKGLRPPGNETPGAAASSRGRGGRDEEKIPFWRELIEHMGTKWFSRKKNKMFFDRRYFPQLGDLARTFEAWGVMAAWDLYLEMDDEFLRKQTGHSLPVFFSRLPGISDNPRWKPTAESYRLKLQGPIDPSVAGLLAGIGSRK